MELYDKNAEIARLRGKDCQLERLCDGYQVENLNFNFSISINII